MAEQKATVAAMTKRRPSSPAVGYTLVAGFSPIAPAIPRIGEDELPPSFRPGNAYVLNMSTIMEQDVH